MCEAVGGRNGIGNRIRIIGYVLFFNKALVSPKIDVIKLGIKGFSRESPRY